MSIAISTASPGAIANYTELVSEVGAWMDRSDLDARIPAFIRIAESRLNRRLRHPGMETTLPYSIAAETNPLPSELLAIRSLWLNTTPKKQLQNLSIPALNEMVATTGDPRAYAVTGTTLRVAPVPSSAVTATLVYYTAIPALTAAAPSNWLLESASDVYLYGTLLAASAFMDDKNAATGWKALYDEALGELIAVGNKSRYGGAPLGPRSTVQVRGAIS